MDTERCEFEPVSLLWKGETRRCVAGAEDACRDLSLSPRLKIKSASLDEIMTDDPETIEYRVATFDDLASIPEALDALKKCVPFISDITDLRALGQDADETGSYLYSIAEVEIYVSLLEHLRDNFLPHRERFTSEALKSLAERISTLAESSGYREINEALAALTSRVREVGSVTLGVNLDARLIPESAGLLSVNNEKFKSATSLEKILKIDRHSGDMNFISPILEAEKVFTTNEREALRAALVSSLSTVFKTSFRSWKRIVRTYVLENTDFLIALLPEIEFISKATSFISDLKERGVEMCRPTVAAGDSVLRAKGLVNGAIALSTDGEIVPNDISFDENAGIYVVTGPNRGGKSVFTAAVGQALVMAQLGLPVAASSFEFTPCDGVFCHFPSGDDDTVEKGRLGEECSRLSEIISKVTKKSVVLLDETLSSTGSIEAASIASEVLTGLAAVGCRTIFSTHLHALAADIPSLNERSRELGGVMIDSLVAEITDGKRSFRIVRAKPGGKSYASDIAEKYGLSLGKILEKVGKGSAEDKK